MTKQDFQRFLESLGKTRFFFFDFDGTIAHTFLHIPNEPANIVVGAYSQALSTIWGKEAFELLHSVNGLQNRAPGELIRAILEQAEKEFAGGRQDLITEAKAAFYEKFMGKPMNVRLSACVAQGKGFPWVWNNKNPEQTITEFLVRAKLDILLVKIGEHYPTPCPGFKHFYQKLHCQEPGSYNVSGIISSGHEVFIQQTFAAWKIKCPNLLLTDDDLRGSHKIDYVQAAKPNPILVDMLYHLWLKSQYSQLPARQFQEFKELAKTRTIYFGDDLNKDGGLAQNAGIRFGHFNPNHDPEKGDETAGRPGNFAFYDWRQVSEILGL